MKGALALVLLLILCQCSVCLASPAEITLWHYFESSNDKDMIEQRVSEYNRLQDQIHITPTYISRQELMSRYTIGAISGQLPDIGMVDSADMAYYISLGVFLDITDELNAWGDLEHFYPGTLRACTDRSGRLYGLPHNSSCLCLAVNTDLMARAGFDRLPASREAFAEMARRMTDPSEGVYGLAMSCIDTEEGTFQMLPWLLADSEGTDDLPSSLAADALDMLGSLVRDGSMSAECVNWNQADAWYSFCEGKAAMVECGTWHLSMTDEIRGAFSYDFCLLPTGNEGESVSIIGGENIGLCAGCTDREGCLAFLEWLCSRENVGIWAVGAGKIPPRDDCDVTYPYEARGFEVFAEEMQYAQARGPYAEWPNISKAINAACQAVIVDGAAPEKALDRAMESVRGILGE